MEATSAKLEQGSPFSCCPNSPQHFPIKPRCPELLGEQKEPAPALPAWEQGENLLELGVRTQQPAPCLGEDVPGGIAQRTQIPGCETSWKFISSGNLGGNECFGEVGLGKKNPLSSGHHISHGKRAEWAILSEKCGFGFSFLLLFLLSIFSGGSPPQLRVQYPKAGGRSWNRDPRAGDGAPRAGHSGGTQDPGFGVLGDPMG